MATRDPLQLAVGIAMIVIGVLLVVGEVSVGQLLGVAGIALVVLGILILVNVLPGGTLIGIVALVLGVLLMANVIPFPENVDRSIRDAMMIINIVVGILLIVFGISKVR